LVTLYRIGRFPTYLLAHPDDIQRVLQDNHTHATKAMLAYRVLARLRAQGQLTELRAADLRFTPDEAARFLTQVMGLALAADDIAALDARTAGWITGLHLAALALHGHADVSRRIASFSGSHRFVLDYLMEEVLDQ
jgi:ATP/maltotriose-dependent transcriptional regulator MalT